MYIVFQDTFCGLEYMCKMNAETLEEAQKNIREDSVGFRGPFKYDIYKTHELDVPIAGTKFDTYKKVSGLIGGSVLELPFALTISHKYAMKHNSSTAWFFTDNMFE